MFIRIYIFVMWSAALFFFVCFLAIVKLGFDVRDPNHFTNAPEYKKYDEQSYADHYAEAARLTGGSLKGHLHSGLRVVLNGKDWSISRNESNNSYYTLYNRHETITVYR